MYFFSLIRHCSPSHLLLAVPSDCLLCVSCPVYLFKLFSCLHTLPCTSIYPNPTHPSITTQFSSLPHLAPTIFSLQETGNLTVWWLPIGLLIFLCSALGGRLYALLCYAKSLHSCPTLCNPMDSSSPGSSVHGILQAGILEWLLCSPPGDLPLPRDQTQVSRCCRRILDCLSHEGRPRILEWVAYSSSRASSQPRNWTGVPHIAGGFFTSWTTREAQEAVYLPVNTLGAGHQVWIMSLPFPSWVTFPKLLQLPISFSLCKMEIIAVPICWCVMRNKWDSYMSSVLAMLR